MNRQFFAALVVFLSANSAFAFDTNERCQKGVYAEQLAATDFYFLNARSADLRAAQRAMRDAYQMTGIVPDGKWGPKTASAVCVLLQIFKDQTGVEFDGVPTAQDFEYWLLETAANTVPGTSSEAAD